MGAGGQRGANKDGVLAANASPAPPAIVPYPGGDASPAIVPYPGGVPQLQGNASPAIAKF